MNETCKVCDQERHWCSGLEGAEYCGNETGHYGKMAAKYCDDCRYVNIKQFGIAGDEPPEQRPAETKY
jgi:hypothetical protein